MITYVAKECVYQNLGIQKIFNEYRIVLWLSVLVLGYISRHKLGVLIYRVIQVVFYLIVSLAIITILADIRDNDKFYLSISF